MADKIYRVPTIYNEMKKTTAPLTVRVPGSKSITNRSLLPGYAGRWRIDLARSIVLR